MEPMKMIIAFEKENISELCRGIIKDTYSDLLVDESVRGDNLEENIRKGGYFLIIAEATLGEMNGIDVPKKVRNLDKKTPFVLITANPDYIKSQTATAGIAISDIYKEIDGDHLCNLVENYMPR